MTAAGKESRPILFPSVAALADTLRLLADAEAARPEGRRGKVHVLAHSLGNRVTLRALEQLNGFVLGTHFRQCQAQLDLREGQGRTQGRATFLDQLLAQVDRTAFQGDG